MKIVISGSAKAFDRATRKLIVDPARLLQLNNLMFAKDSCGQYLSEPLHEIGVIGGQIQLSFPAADSSLRVLTIYHAPRELKPSEILLLLTQTTGQWSDGIGEGEFQHGEELGIDINISPFDSEPTVEQVDDGVVVSKPQKNELIEVLRQWNVDEEAAMALVRRGAPIDARDRDGLTVLELACRAVLPDLVDLLLQKGAMAISENRNRTISKLAYCQGAIDIMEKSARVARSLIESGVEVDTFNDGGATPLMMAANRDNLPLVKYLLSKGADINARQADQHNRCSVLMYAGKVEMVRYLLENGADPNIRNAQGNNAYQVRLQNSHQKDYQVVADLIKSYMN